ncbi:acyl-homoserine-lactone synthase [Celeribacter sp. ULVN23_4]
MALHTPTEQGLLSINAFPDLVPCSNDEISQIASSGRKNTPQRTAKRETTGRIRATVLSVQNNHLYGELYADFLRARKRVFIDTKHWDLPETDGMEFDQYDTPQSRCIVLHEYGQVIAGIRLLPTTARCGCYSYMLKDAQEGVIDTIPSYILHEKAPVSDWVWEATRLFVVPEVPANRRLTVQTKLMQEMARTAVAEGATHVIGIVPYVFKRWLERLGMSALPVGPKVMFDSDKSQAALMHVAKMTMMQT